VREKRGKREGGEGSRGSFEERERKGKRVAAWLQATAPCSQRTRQKTLRHAGGRPRGRKAEATKREEDGRSPGKTGRESKPRKKAWVTKATSKRSSRTRQKEGDGEREMGRPRQAPPSVNEIKLT